MYDFLQKLANKFSPKSVICCWYRCARCGRYTKYHCRCSYVRKSLSIPISLRQKQRVLFHQAYADYWLEGEQDQFVSFALRLEDLTGHRWKSGDAARLFYALPDDNALVDFLAFYDELASRHPDKELRLSGVIKLWISVRG